jgi:hypothetical protein
MEGTTQEAPRAEVGVLGRIFGVFFSPGETFASIARKPGWDWLVPIALLAVAILFSSAMSTPRMDEEGFVQTFMKKMEANPNIGEAQREEIEQGVRKQFTFSRTLPGKLLGVVAFVLPIFIVPLFYHWTAMAMGAKTGYVKVMAGYAWVQMVHVVWWLVHGLIAMTKTRIDVVDLQMFRLVKSNPGAFMNVETTNRALLVLASSIDVFEIAGLVLGSIALSKTTRFSPRGAAVTVVSFWLVWVVLKMIGGTLQAAFGS